MEDVVEEVQSDIVEKGAVLEGAELPVASVSEEVVSQEETQDVVVEENETQDVVEEDFKVSKADWDKVQEQLEQKEQFIQERNNEVGDLRQQRTSLEQQVRSLNKSEDELNDLYLENPAKAIQEQQALQNTNDQLRHVVELENKVTIMQSDPQFEDKVGEMAEMMISDGYDPVSVQRFKSNPYAIDVGVTMSYAKQVGQERRIKALEANNETLKQKPAEVAKKIEAAANSGKTITAGTGGSIGGDIAVTSEMVEQMDSKTRRHFIETGEVLVN